MKKTIVSFSLFLLAILALSAPVRAQDPTPTPPYVVPTQKVETPSATATQTVSTDSTQVTVKQKVSTARRSKRCHYTSTVKRHAVPKGCNACARLLVIEQEIALLLSKPDIDWTRVEKLEKEYDNLLPRVVALEGDVGQLKTDFSNLRSDVDAYKAKFGAFEQATTEEFVAVNSKISKLESECKAVPRGDKLYNSCTGERIKTGGCGKACWIFRGLTIYSTAASTYSLFNNGGGSRGPQVSTLPPGGGLPVVTNGGFGNAFAGVNPGGGFGSSFGGGSPPSVGGVGNVVNAVARRTTGNGGGFIY